jgi:protein-S-isoprenylcysteine O-methyltransferase Ste14
MPISFWIILIAVFLYGLIHSLLASLKAKETTQRWFGPTADRYFRLFYNFIAFVALLPVLLLPIILIDKELYRIPFPWVIITLLLQGLAVIVLIIGLRQTGIWSFIGLRQLLKPTNNERPKFVSDGLYRWVRHPLYTAGLVIIWLIPVMTCNLLALIIGLTLYIIIGAIVEERKLFNEYGEVYTEYKARTPMLIPGLLFRKQDSKDDGSKRD